MSNKVALVLGTSNMPAIKQALQEKTLVDVIRGLVKASNFYRDGTNEFCYAKVATFLEEGWQSQQHYTTLQSGCQLTLIELGQAVNAVIGGTRFDYDQAKAVDCDWTCAGAYPTKADLGAFLFYICVEAPKPLPPVKPKTAVSVLGSF